jgi:hypothetical protein
MEYSIFLVSTGDTGSKMGFKNEFLYLSFRSKISDGNIFKLHNSYPENLPDLYLHFPG